MGKSITITLVALLSAANLCLAGGAKVFVSVNPSYCRPAPVLYCPPVYRPLPSFGGCQPISYYSWGPSVIAYTTSPGSSFTTVSTSSFQRNAGVPVYSVPAPTFPTSAVTTYPGTSFSWRR